MRTLTLALTTAAAVLALALPASAVHEANNRFDMRDLAGGTADATGISNFHAGNTGWNNQIRVDGLLPLTDYTWVGLSNGGATVTPICSLTTDATGSGSCTSEVNSRLGSTQLRLGDATGAAVLAATASTDEGGDVQDGEIERSGTERFKG